MNLNELNPYIRRAMPCVLGTNWHIDRRIIYDYELIYIEKGKFVFSYNEKEYICGEGTIIFIRPGIPHAFVKILEELHQPHIHFDIAYSANSEIVPICFKDYPDMNENEKSQIRLDVFSMYPHNPFITINDKDSFFNLFYKIISMNSIDNCLLQKALLIQLLSIIIKDNFPASINKPIKSSIIVQIKDYIDSGQGMSFSLDDFEKYFSYNKYHLEKLFQAKYQKSIIAYRNEKRMTIAKELLLSDKSVTFVSEKLGFSSIYAFSRAFKLHFGYSPIKIRQQKNR